MPIFFVTFEGTPRRGSAAEDVGGALINCWMRRDTVAEAVAGARAGIEVEGWIVGEPDEAREVGDAEFPPEAEGREYYEQALREPDGEVLVFYQYPEVDEDETD